MSRTAWGFTATLADGREWMRRAACSPDTAEAFWITEKARKLSADNMAAIQMCLTCPVIRECDADDRAHPQPWPRIVAGRIEGGRR